MTKLGRQQNIATERTVPRPYSRATAEGDILTPGRRRERSGRVRRSWMAALVGTLIAAGSVSGATGWSDPSPVGPAGTSCYEVALAVDAWGTPHVAATCDIHITYSVQRGSGWSTTTFRQSSGVDRGPQLALDGNTLYLAFTRTVDELTGTAIGVFYRTRELPSGAWSSLKRLGAVGDGLVAFRVADDVLHAVVRSRGGSLLYETLRGTSLKRFAIPRVTEISRSSLRVGSDGRARVAYSDGRSLLFGVFTGTRFTVSSIPGTTAADREPVLVLDGRNRPHIAWYVPDWPEPAARSGTYYATTVSGTWTASTARRFTRNVSLPSLTLDVATGRAHILLGLGEGGLKYYTKSATGTWGGVTLTTAWAHDAVIRLDQARNRLFATYIRFVPGRSTTVNLVTRP